jgi:hypothetical protein
VTTPFEIVTWAKAKLARDCHVQVQGSLVWGLYRKNDRLVLFGTQDDVDNLAGFVAFEAVHLTDRRRQRRPDAVLSTLEAAL